MALFPPAFIDDLQGAGRHRAGGAGTRAAAEGGATYKGLCPFHGEKTPSFHVNRDKGFFHCFGCGVGGDVFKFVELQREGQFPEAVRQLAARVGLPVPEPEDANAGRGAAREREALLKAHEVAAAWFQGAAGGAGGRRGATRCSQTAA